MNSKDKGITNLHGPDKDPRSGIFASIKAMLEPKTGTGIAGLMGASMIPGVGEAIDIADIGVGISERDASRVGIASLGLMMPFVGAAGIKKMLKSLKPKRTLKLLKRIAQEINLDPHRNLNASAMDNATEEWTLRAEIDKDKADRALLEKLRAGEVPDVSAGETRGRYGHASSILEALNKPVRDKSTPATKALKHIIPGQPPETYARLAELQQVIPEDRELFNFGSLARAREASMRGGLESPLLTGIDPKEFRELASHLDTPMPSKIRNLLDVLEGGDSIGDGKYGEVALPSLAVRKALDRHIVDKKARELLDRGIPSLMVVGHEGRHRARILEALGRDYMPITYHDYANIPLKDPDATRHFSDFMVNQNGLTRDRPEALRPSNIRNILKGFRPFTERGIRSLPTHNIYAKGGVVTGGNP